MKNNRTKVLINFKKAKSLLEKIIEMTEKDEYCIDIMQQNLAVISLLRSANEMLMEDHLKTCFSSACDSKNQAKKKRMVEEILRVKKIYNR